MNKRIEGIITNKKSYSGNSDKAPAGDLYIDRDKFTCWDKDIFAQVNIGDSVGINHDEKENEFNGRKYTNRNVISIDEQDTQRVDGSDIRYSEEEKEKLEDVGVTTETKSPSESIPFKSEPFKMSGFTYRVVGILELQ